ncbi:hypothetical protein JB92DRAFT_2865029 [Gautieria morchelliformis]|nr:hypothetical protein JB92DRAFT_2865029 [Gautieria morchelliformis]
MAYYSYYQNSQPTWGTQQYQFVPPPTPLYQPQPSWHGGDYYRAHADSPDNNLFDYVLSKVKNIVTGTSVGRNEAHHLWKRVYGGLINPSKLLPREIGAAAGYEAIRCWEHHKAIYVQPLSDDREREREALIGLAAAEATKLWGYTLRPRDKYGRMEASEVAAATASRIFTKSYDYDTPYESYERYPRTRRRSISGTRYGSRSNENALYDDAVLDTRADYLDAYPRRSRSRSRARSFSRYRTPSPVTFSSRPRSPIGYGGMGSGSAVGLTSAAITYPTAQYDPVLGPGIPGTYYPNASPYYGASSTGYGSQQLPPTTGYAVAGASPYMSSTYAGSTVGLPPPPTGPYLSAPNTSRHHRARSTGSYGAARPSFGY